MKSARKEESGREEAVDKINEQMLIEADAVRKKLTVYFEELLNREDVKEADLDDVRILVFETCLSPSLYMMGPSILFTPICIENINSKFLHK